MPISNVALTNTFDQWRTTTNQVITALNDFLNDGAPTITYRNVTANNVFANNINIGSLPVTNIFDRANAANVLACTAFDRANSGVRTGWTTIVANTPTTQVSMTPASNNDTLTLRTTGNVSITGVSANDNIIFDLTTTGVTAGSYGSTSAVPVITVDSRGRLTTVTTASIDTTTGSAAFDRANAANVLACTAFDRANSGVRTGWTTIVANTPTSEVIITPASNNDTLTLRTTGNVSITGVSANDNIIFDLTTTGVSAGSYGSSSDIPVITVDSRGRLTSVTTTSLSVAAAPAAFDKANAANVLACTAFDRANSAVRTGWTTIVANTPTTQVSITPASNNDTLTLRTTGNVSITGVSANDNIIFDLTTTGVSAGSYGTSVDIPVITVDSRGRLTSVTTTSLSLATATAAFDQANTARTHANGAFLTSNAAFDQANTARTHANGAFLTSNAAFDQANTARTHANGAFLTSNAAFDQANTARTHANGAFLQANTAYSSAVLKTGNTMTGSLVMSAANIIMDNNILSRPRINNYSITASTIGNATGSVTIDLNNGHYFTATTTGSTTWTFSNPSVTGNASGFILILTNGGSASQLWPPAVDWQNGIAPTLTASGVDVLAFITNDGGTIWRGVLSVKDSK